MTIVAIITVRCEATESFRTFERHAAVVMARHGGAIERAVVIPAEAGGATFREIHIVTFPDTAAFDAYRADPALAEIAHLRGESVISTEMFVGEDGPDYGAA